METFTCDVCGQTYEKSRPDEAALKEYEELYQEEAAQGMDKGIVCHECFLMVDEWVTRCVKGDEDPDAVKAELLERYGFDTEGERNGISDRLSA